YMGNDKEFISTSEQQNFLTNDSSSFVNKNGRNVNRSHSLNLNFRLRWEIDTLTTLEFMPRFGFNKSHLENNGFTETMGGYRDAELAARDSVNDQDSRSGSDAHGYNLSGRLSFSRAFKNNPRRKLSFSFNYSANRNEEDGESYDVFNFYRTGVRDSIRHQTDETISKGASYDVRATYVEPLSKHYYLNFVYQYRYNTSDGDAYTYNLGSDYNDKTYLDVDSLGNPIADTDYSNVSRSRTQTHRGELSLRGVYTKMYFNVGVNLEHQKRETNYLYGRNVGDDITQNTLNFSPTLRLRYRINKYENLRFNYRGSSSQPSTRQLQASPDITDPLNIYQGNPELKASFTHDMSLRYNSYNPETYSSLSVDFSAKVLQNNISEKTTYNDDGGRTRTPENVNGAWNTSIRVFYNMPFKMNKKFSLNSNSRLSYDKSVGFVSLSSKSDAVENTSRQYNAEENLSLRYSSDIVSASVGGNYTYSSVVNTMQPDNNQSTMNFGARADLDVFLTCGVSIGTDCRYQGTAGYAEGYNQNKVIWNASIAYSFLQKKNATIRFKVYDILQQNTSIERRVSSSYIMDQETNTLGSYCMLYFAYQFNTLGKGGHGGDRGGRGGFGGPGGGGPGGPGGGGPGGYGGFR
ncbi:MAG: outer membrane beta-barrel family protein, partial [Porphyromonadaceae bacterium]|nr:outer membrane beta-barrel family protein [Porphyromonadaceae bacterium]